MLTAGTTTTTMNLGNVVSTDFTDDNIQYNEAIIVPQDMSGKVLTFTLSDGTTMTYTFPDNTTFECGKKYRYHLTLSRTGITLEGSTVSNWAPNTTDSSDEENAEAATNVVNLGDVTTDCTISSNTILTGTNSTAVTITIAEGATDIIFKEATFADNTRVKVSTTATIHLIGANTMSTNTTGYSPLTITGGTEDAPHTLTITGTDADELDITTKNHQSPCIRSDNKYSHIIISGGTVEATATNEFSCAIGAGLYGTSGDITISGGEVIAKASTRSAAAIGCTLLGGCGDITITGSGTKVTATSNSLYDIGPGHYGSQTAATCGTVTIGDEVTVQRESGTIRIYGH